MLIIASANCIGINECVIDHILTLQHSLAHYERMLSQSHPVYLSHLRTTVAITKAGADKALIYLTVCSIGVLCIQTLIGTCHSACCISTCRSKIAQVHSRSTSTYLRMLTPTDTLIMSSA